MKLYDGLVLGTFATMTNVWTGNTKSVVNIASLGNINLQLARPECYDDTATYQTIWYARMALPCAIFLPALLILTFVKHFADNVVPRGTISRIFLIVMIFLFVSTSITTLELFDCSRRSDGTYIMDASPDIECFDGVWWEMFPVACAGILFYVLGVPLGTYKIWKKHGNFRPPEYRDDDKKRMYSWESVILLRKLLLIVLSLFLNDKPIAFFITASGVLGTALYFHVIYRPYKQARHNVMDSCMLVTLLGFVVSTLVLSEGNDKDVEIVIYWIDVSLFALTLLTFAYVWFADIRDAYSSNSTSSQEMSHQPTANQQGESKAAQKPEPSPPTGPAYMHYAAGSNEFDTSHTDEQTRTHRQSREMATFDDGHQSMALHYADDGVGTQPRLGTALENSV
eukprot:TRINITY_DN820_c0_g1_i5.p1 TRINITY_DN820_c0_g1~~TRINITY_DN820_c0_g1_i5.p1  ORF type:complete len:396 (-),score=48.93 TRINITY_DN820_c0_g1_i5:180-1367(-)